MLNPNLLDNLADNNRKGGQKLLEAIDDFIVMSVHLELPVQSPNKVNLEGIYP